MTRDELVAAMTAIGRPEATYANGIRGLHEGLQRRSAWDKSHPAELARWRELAEQVNALDDAQAELERAAAQERRAHDAVHAHGGGARSAKAATKPKETPAIVATRKWLTEKPASWALVLRGDVGSGKTVAGHFAMFEAAKAGKSVKLRKTGEILRLSGFGEGADELKSLKRVGLLVVDDFGSEPLNDWGRGLLTELLDARYEASAATVITANPTWEQLKERLGQRLVDRLRHGGKLVELGGLSLRRVDAERAAEARISPPAAIAGGAR